MDRETLISRFNDANYKVYIDKSTAILLMKHKSQLIQLMPKKVQLTYIAYKALIYIMRGFSLAALPMSYYYDIADWWYGLFGWLLSDYLYYELTLFGTDEIMRHAMKDDTYFQALTAFGHQHKLTIFNSIKKTDFIPTPLYKKIIEIFAH